MSESSVSVSIMDRDYKIACSAEDRPSLLKAAAMVDTRMRDVRSAQKTLTIERIAVLVALTLASDVLRQTESNEVVERLQALSERLGEALSTTD